MSKEKAKLKAIRKNELKISRERDLSIKIENERKLFLENEKEKIERNQHYAERRELLNDRLELSKDPKFRFANKHQNAIFNAVVSKIGGNKQLAYDFLLEELEAASHGNSIAKKFARNSGISEELYIGAMKRHLIEVESGPQSALNAESISIAKKYGIDFIVLTRLAVVDKVMQLYGLGKYSEENPSGEESSEGLFVKSSEKELRALFEEYFEYCKSPKKFSTAYLTKTALKVCRNINSQSTALKDHLLLMRIISLAGDKVRSARIPAEFSVITGLRIVSFIDFNVWLDILRKVKDIAPKDELIRSIDLCRQIGDPGEKCIINFAPAVYNLFRLIYAEYPESEYKDSIKKIMWDASFVEGTKLPPNQLGKLWIWAASV